MERNAHFEKLIPNYFEISNDSRHNHLTVEMTGGVPSPYFSPPSTLDGVSERGRFLNLFLSGKRHLEAARGK